MQAGFAPTVEPADIDETRHAGEAPEALVERLAKTKAEAVAHRHADDASSPAILAADTIVWLESGEVLGKPRDTAHAEEMLHELFPRLRRLEIHILYNEQIKNDETEVPA